MSDRSPKQRGFTVIELMITVIIAAVALTLGMPSMISAIEKRRTIAAAERVYGQLQLARLQAVARSQPVIAEFWFDDPDWGMGITNNAANCDPEDNNPVCSLPDVTGANAVTYWISGADFTDITVESSANITFSPQRATATAAGIDIVSTGRVGYAMRVEVGVLGQISMCSPDADPATFVGGYRPC
jgi:type IV fimbrial biogenesis protein FimT